MEKHAPSYFPRLPTCYCKVTPKQGFKNFFDVFVEQFSILNKNNDSDCCPEPSVEVAGPAQGHRVGLGGRRGRQDRVQGTLRKETERHTSSLPVGAPVSVQLSQTGFV